MTRASGPDISFYQDDNSTPEGVDFDVMSERADFVIIRAGQNTWVDSDFLTNWTDALEAGIPRGSYWYYDSRSTPKSQAERWVEALGEDTGELPLFADFEEDYGGAYAGWSPFYVFLEELKKLLPEKEIIIYTGYYYWKDNVADVAPEESVNYFKQYDCWISRYSDSEPWVPQPWEDWTFWQYTATGPGELYGVESKGIDLNYYNGTVEEFKVRFGIDKTVPPVDPPTEPPVVDSMIDAILELAKQTGRIADAIESGGVISPPTNPPTNPPAEYPKHWQLINPQKNGNVPFFRNDDVNDNKITVWKDNVVSEYLPPQKYWDNAADLENVLKSWAWIPLTVVHNAGGKAMMMPDDFTTTAGKDTDNWFGGGFVERNRLQKV